MGGHSNRQVTKYGMSCSGLTPHPTPRSLAELGELHNHITILLPPSPSLRRSLLRQW